MSKKKLFKISAACAGMLMALGVMSGSAYAGASLHTASFSVAEEKITTTAPYSTALNVAFEPGGAVAAGTTLKISLTNAKFKTAGGATYDLCDSTGASVGGPVAPSATNPSIIEYPLSTPLAGGQVYVLQDGACALPFGTATIEIPSGTQAGTVVTMAVDNKLTPGDPNVYATAPAINVKKQFTAMLTPATSIIDFNSGLKSFVGGLNSNAKLTLISDESITDRITLGGNPTFCTGTLAPGDKLIIKITGNLDGVSSTFYDTLASQPVTSTDKTNGYTTLAVAGNNLKICDSAVTPSPQNLGLTVSGSDVLSPRNFTAQIALDLTASNPGYLKDLIAAGTTSHIWKLDSTQYYIPLIKYDSTKGEETYIKIQSKSTFSGTNGVMVQILASDGSLVTYNAGTITSGQPMVIKGSDLVNAVTGAGKTVDGSKGFAAIITVNSSERDVFAYANTCDGSGNCKRIPVKSVTIFGNILE